MGDRLIPVADWVLMAVGLIAVAVILSVIDRDVALWEEEREGKRDA